MVSDKSTDDQILAINRHIDDIISEIDKLQAKIDAANEAANEAEARGGNE